MRHHARSRQEENWRRNLPNHPNAWPPWPPNFMPGRQQGGNFHGHWSYQQERPQLSESDQFREAYQSERHDSSRWQENHFQAPYRINFPSDNIIANQNNAFGHSGVEFGNITGYHHNQKRRNEKGNKKSRWGPPLPSANQGCPSSQTSINVSDQHSTSSKPHNEDSSTKSETVEKLKQDKVENQDIIVHQNQIENIAQERLQTFQNTAEPHSSQAKIESCRKDKSPNQSSVGLKKGNSPAEPSPSVAKKKKKKTSPEKGPENKKCQSIESSSKPKNNKNEVSGSHNSSRGNFSNRGRGAHNGSSLLGKPPPLLGRAPPLFGNQYQSNRWNTFRNIEEEDEGNEINAWLQSSKDTKSLSSKESNPVSKDPLPGSEEARTNAIKEATDRLKQALKKKKNVNLNELLSSGDESKGESPSLSKVTTFPKNLANLELDATDMRAIGRANTEKTNCVAEDNSDDDIVEVERPPSPVRTVIDLDISPTKNAHVGDISLNSYNQSNTQSPAQAESLEGEISPPFDNCVIYTPSEGCDRQPEDPPRNESVPVQCIVSDNLNKEGKQNQENCCKHLDCEIALTCGLKTSGEKPLKFDGESAMTKSETLDENDCETSNLSVNLCSSTDSVRLSSLSNNANKDTSLSVTVAPRIPPTESTSPSCSRLLKNALPPSPNLIQRRRRASSSSLCESPSPRIAPDGLSHPRPQYPKSSHFEPGSPPMLSPSSHNSRQRKIISDLQKINQSKIRDLINNPRSGKLDFAMRQLMKEHQAVLSKQSRDVAEKRIPAEFLNPKSTDLPPDDNTLLADFAIDWSSLPAELICTLGDLFQDCSSEVDATSSDSHILNSAESCEISDSVLLSSGDSVGIEVIDDVKPVACDQEKSSNHSVEEDHGIIDYGTPLMQNTEHPVRIRVRPFARENLFSSKESNCADSELNSFESSSPESVMPKTTNATDPAAPLEDTIRSVEISNEKITRPEIIENYGENQPSTNNEGNCKEDNNGTIRISNNVKATTLESGSHRINKSSISLINIRNTTPKKGKNKGKKKNRKNNLVRLEERSWFGDSSGANNSVVSSSKSKSYSSLSGHSIESVSSKSYSNVQPENLPSSSETTRTSEDNIENVSFERNSNDLPSENNIQDLPVERGVEVIDNAINKNSACTSHSVTSNTASVMNDFSSMQSISMLPVLMMTVPADGVSDIVCNLTVSEMQTRIAQIDLALQNLVQERFVLSQALKAAQPIQDCNGSISITKNAVSNLPSNVQPTVENNEPNSNDTDAGQGKRKSVKRKLSASDTDRVSKKRSQSDSLKNSSSVIPSKAISVENCVVQPEKRSGKESELIVLDDDEDDGDDRSVNSVNVDVYVARNGFSSIPGVEGNILDIKMHSNQIFAASQNGLVYLLLQTKREPIIKAVFGDKSPRGITCIAIAGDPIQLYTGSGDGIFSVYEMPASSLQGSSQLIRKPKSSFNISSAIHCMEKNWGFVYIGTKAGSVIPFNTTTKQVGEPLSVDGYPVLCIKSCMEGPRKVLVVAYRQQPIAIRDASSGLLLRSLGGCDWTVYSILLDKNLVYCGANSDSVAAYDFQSGQLKFKLQAGRGVIVMKLCEPFLFCGCYDGKIYVFNLEDNKLMAVMNGPSGKMILSLHTLKKMILCGSKDGYLASSKLPWFLKRHIRRKAQEKIAELKLSRNKITKKK